MVKELKPIFTPARQEDSVAREIYTFLKDTLLQPLLDELNEKQKLYYNSNNIIVKAIQSGKIGYKDGIIKGSFNASIIKEFNKLGYKFDNRIKGYKLNINTLPISVQIAIGKSSFAGKQLSASLISKLDSINIDKEIKKFTLIKKYLDILNLIDQDLERTAFSVLGLEVKTTESQKLKLAKDFTNNAELFIKDFAEKEITKLRTKIEKNVFEGVRAETLRDEIKKEFGVSKNKANFLARQEVSLFTSKYKQAKYQELGITKYRWSTSRDGRVRDDHQQLNGKIFYFDSPPVENKETGNRANPGEPFGCRCVAIPVIE